MDRVGVIRLCIDDGVTIAQRMIDTDLFLRQLKASGASQAAAH
jgi:hypothetical protein